MYEKENIVVMCVDNSENSMTAFECEFGLLTFI